MPIYLPKEKKRKNKHVSFLNVAPTGRVSLVPFSGKVLEPYIISPSSTALQAQLAEFLKNLDAGVDSLNGNALDNLITSWKETALAQLEQQRVDHRMKIVTLSTRRAGVKTDAECKLTEYSMRLARTEELLRAAEKKYAETTMSEEWRKGLYS